MTDAEKEQVWNALHSGRLAAAHAYRIAMHLEGATALFQAVDAEICAAMEIINKDDAKEQS